MNYTENYHLPQWEETDRIMRTDFNRMCSDLEDGLTRAQTAADLPAYVVGTYLGDQYEIPVVLGFKPSLVLIAKPYSSSTPEDTYGAICCFTQNCCPADTISFDDNGFTVYGKQTYPNLNWVHRQYCYIAFR